MSDLNKRCFIKQKIFFVIEFLSSLPFCLSAFTGVHFVLAYFHLVWPLAATDIIRNNSFLIAFMQTSTRRLKVTLSALIYVLSVFCTHTRRHV